LDIIPITRAQLFGPGHVLAGRNPTDVWNLRIDNLRTWTRLAIAKWVIYLHDNTLELLKVVVREAGRFDSIVAKQEKKAKKYIRAGNLEFQGKNTGNERWAERL